MLGVLAKYIQDVSVVRRLLFAVVFLSPDLPMYWGVVLEFATAGKVPRSSVTPDQVKALVENIETRDMTAFQTAKGNDLFDYHWKEALGNSSHQSS